MWSLLVHYLKDDEDEAENTDRLVIDEGRDASSDASSNVIPADQVPECQGCHKKAAQFVCAGCGNQWYCSRECQVGHRLNSILLPWVVLSTIIERRN